MDELNIAPEFYVVSRELTDEQLALVQHALGITPIDFVIVDTAHDVQFARHFSDSIFIAGHGQTLTLAPGEQPYLIVGKANILEAHYAGGEVQKIV